MNKENLLDDNLIELKKAHFRRGPDAGVPSSDPAAPTPMELVDVDQIDFYDRNPRQAENPEFQNIKNAIRTSKGLDWVLNITRRPGAECYMMAAGGNTTLRAVKELLEETGESCFRQIHCLYTPWTGDDNVLLAHLKENDQRSDLILIDRARAVRELRKLIEAEAGEPLSQRSFVEQLKARGYNISRRMLGWLDYALDTLYPVIPDALEAGMGKTQIEQLHKIERAFCAAWEFLGLEDAEIEGIFTEVLKRHNWEYVDPDLVRDDLEAELAVSADCDHEEAGRPFAMALNTGLSAEAMRAELAKFPDVVHFAEDDPLQKSGHKPSAATGDDSVGNGKSHAGRPAREPKKKTPPEIPDAGDDMNITSSDSVAPPESALSPDAIPQNDSPFDTHPRQPSPAKPAAAGAILPDDLRALRKRAFDLARDIATQMGAGDIVKPIDVGYGFLVGPLPDGGRNLKNIHSNGHNDASRPLVLSLWWMLSTISEQFEDLGNATPYVPPEWADREIGEVMRQAKAFHIWQINNLVSQEVPYIPLPHLGTYGFNVLDDLFWDAWVDLVNTTRRIFKFTLEKPWTQEARHAR